MAKERPLFLDDEEYLSPAFYDLREMYEWSLKQVGIAIRSWDDECLAVSPRSMSEFTSPKIVESVIRHELLHAAADNNLSRYGGKLGFVYSVTCGEITFSYWSIWGEMRWAEMRAQPFNDAYDYWLELAIISCASGLRRITRHPRESVIFLQDSEMSDEDLSLVEECLNVICGDDETKMKQTSVRIFSEASMRVKDNLSRAGLEFLLY